MPLAVAIATYERPDGRSPAYLSRALASVRAQTFTDYKIFLVADAWQDIKELERIADFFKCGYFNNPIPVERNKYPEGGRLLWCAAGITPSNLGIELALDEGFSHVCRLDHDDFWREDHLQLIASKIDQYNIVVTRSTHPSGQVLPEIDGDTVGPPRASGMCHSATCVNFRALNVRYRDKYEETWEAMPPDADLWERLSNESVYYINELTCFHDSEGYVMS